MSRRLIPSASIGRWGGPGDDGETDYDGRSLVIEWLGFIIEICLGRAK